MNFASAGTETAIVTSFILFMCLCLLVCTWSAPDSDDAAEFYTARRNLGPVSNGLAISGDYITVITLLGTTTVIATAGYDARPRRAVPHPAVATLPRVARPLQSP
jgi:Na+(H+)/acetate symporter ActP